MKSLTHLFCFIAIIFTFKTSSFAQCNVCTVDLTCDSVPAGPKICPRSLPPGTAGTPYEESFTFFLPTNFDITTPVSGNVTLNQVDVKAVNGVPTGLSWTGFDHNGTSNTTFYPTANPPATERGCATVCGTPLIPGTYTITVVVDAHVQLSGISQISEQAFPMTLVILPNASGNSAFTLSADNGCDTVKTTFEPVLKSNGSDLFDYDWDFGDGSTSTDEFPAEVVYDKPGEYIVQHTTTQYQYFITDVSLTSTDNTVWCNDASFTGGEAGVGIGFCTGNPDIFFTVTDGGANSHTSPQIDGNKTPSWSNLNMQVDAGNPVTLSFTDVDLIDADDDLGSATVSITAAGNYPITGTGFSGSITVSRAVSGLLEDQDTITVLAPPAITATTVTPSNSVCSGDSIMLSSSAVGAYQWLKDSVDIIGETTNELWVKSNGRYMIKVTDNNSGCSGFSIEDTITILGNPATPNFVQLGDKLQTFVSAPNLQWYLDGNPIPGATDQIHVFTATGNYNLKATGANGCESWATELSVVYTPTSIFESKEIVKLVKIIPNPNDGKFSVSFQSFEAADITYQIVDLSGRIVFEKQLNGIYGKYNDEIDLSKLNAGIYFLNLSSEEQKINKKLIIR